MDKNLIKDRFSRSIPSYNGSACAQRLIAEKLCSLLSGISGGQRDAGNVLEIGCGTGILTRMFLKYFTASGLTLVDICPEVIGMLGDIKCRFIAGDAEKCSLPAGQDLIISCSAIQWFEDQDAFLSKCNGLLNGKGLIAISTFGPDNLSQIKTITGCGLDYCGKNAVCDAVGRAGFRILAADEEHIEMIFPTPQSVLHHLKSTGVTGISRTSWTKGRLKEFTSAYQEKYGLEDGNVPLTYHPIYIIAEKS